MQLSYTSPPSYHVHHFLYMHPIYSLTAEVTNVKFKNAKGLHSLGPWRAYIKSQLQTRMIPSVEVRTPREGCWWKHSVRWTWGERREAGREAAECTVSGGHTRERGWAERSCRPRKCGDVTNWAEWSNPSQELCSSPNPESQGHCERLLLNEKTPGFLASRGEEFSLGPETRLDLSELCVIKFY